MVKNYIKIAVRNLFKHKTFSFINILGLTGGLTCCLLIFIFVNDELSYDKFHSKSERIYRIQYDIQEFHIGQIPPVFAEHFESFFPEIEKTARWFSRGASIRVNPAGGGAPKRFEERVFFTDSSAFDIFDFQFVEGSQANALREPMTIILNEEIKQKYFGNEMALDKTVYVEGKPFRVKGVVKDFPNNSHLHFDMLMPYKDQLVIENDQVRAISAAQMQGNWIYSHSSTYILLKEGQQEEAVEAKFVDFVDQKIPDQMKMSQSFLLQPLTDIHMNEEVSGINDNAGSRTFIMVFVAVGILTLLIACINFINLSTARSLQRTKEIGMRKVMGAWKSSLIAQFLGESFVTTAFASILAFVATFFLIPVLNDMTGRELSASLAYDPIVLMSLGALFFTTSILAGIYPAFFVTKISPIYSLKGLNSKDTKGGLSFRRGLMIVQFSISIFLISGTLIVFDQLDMLRNKPMGFQKEHMITVPLQSQSLSNVFLNGIDEQLKSKIEAFETELLASANIEQITLSSGVLGSGVVQRNIVPEGFTAEDKLLAPVLSVDYDYAETYGLEVIAGRNFSKDFGTDEAEAFMINEQAIEEYNWGSAEEALGKTINVEGKTGRVIGVVKDFNFMALTEPLTTLVMHIAKGQFTTFSMKINNQNIGETLTFIDGVWNRYFPNETFSHTFLDERIDQLYMGQERLGKMVGNFSILAILISCLGSYGLIIFVAGQKMKEVGIRKVLGASVSGLVMMLSRQFMILALISIVLAVPAAYWAADTWLEDFSYRVDISPLSFLIAGLATVGLVLITIGYKSFRTAIANPVRALRNE